MTLTKFRTLGRSGLIVSPLALGTMTFGNPHWGSPDEISEAIFHDYVHSGGNFIDTADVYADGRSEELIGGFIAERKLRDQIVLATKCTFHDGEAANVNAGGNGRKNLERALAGSLRRLQTDYIDLFWMHAWDRVTPVEEVLESLGNLVRAGKIRYFGFSDVPAWYATKAATLAAVHGVPGPIALQLEYSLVERNIEREHVPAARECGLGICPWSPLASGFLTGKYALGENGEVELGGGRLDSTNSVFQRFTAHNWRVLDAVNRLATQLNRPAAQIALAWAFAQPGITSLILGASELKQLHTNVAALQTSLSSEHLHLLDEASALDRAHPYMIFSDDVNREHIFGGTAVQAWR